MARKCTICSHPKKQEIDRAILDGNSSNRRIASQYDVTERAVRNHKASHLPGKLARATEAANVASADDLLQQVHELRARAMSILNKAEKAGDHRTALHGIREARACIELLLEVEGRLERNATVNVLVTPEWTQIQAVLLTTLEPFPAARVAVSEALAGTEPDREGGVVPK